MDKRYQVFVSSTYDDLQEERKEVMQLYQDTATKKRTEEYWQLTPYGDHKMMELLAIKRE